MHKFSLRAVVKEDHAEADIMDLFKVIPGTLNAV